jgi:crotonobetainyl-CoA:carnitine CoA-transferase CaiB-like acyl-CoA transferase
MPARASLRSNRRRETSYANATPSGFLIWNRGKESLVADLRTPEGQSALKDLVADADVVIEAFGPNRTRAWGVDAETLCALNPRLVHGAITGFGPTGPYAGIKGHDSLIAAKAGLWSRGAFGHREGPIMYPVPWGSFGAAMQSVAGILGALRVRDFIGRGQQLDATLWAGLEPIDYFVAASCNWRPSAARSRRQTRARHCPQAATECWQ